MIAPDPVEPIARALLYEGFALYPYRASALKNRQRWFFGGVWPADWSAAHPGDAAALSADVLLEGAPASTVTVEVRFLQPAGDAVERRVPLDGVALGTLLAQPLARRFALAPLAGELVLAAEPEANGLARLAVTLRNISAAGAADRDAALDATMASAHVVLGARDGAWVSLLDPPPAHADAASRCTRDGFYPALAGAIGARDRLLLAPIALPDYPRVAPESPGDLFDGTEIDELLTLRVMTLADTERAELLATAPARVRELLQRVDALSPARLGALHGAVRERGRADDLARGRRVRLHPRRGGDVMDLALAGRTATVAAVERDVDGGTHVAVVLDDDPGADLGAAGFHGHRFFFTPAELEPL